MMVVKIGSLKQSTSVPDRIDTLLAQQAYDYCRVAEVV